MRSIDFIKTRRTTWISLENEIKTLGGRVAGSESESLLISFINHYRRTIADLSLAQSLFPKSQLVGELNHLIVSAMVLISSRQKTDFTRIKLFFTERLPLLVIGLHKLFCISCAIFIISAAAGYGLTMVNPFTANVIVGDEYIFKTIENIENGNPFAVYESRFKYAMSSFIMANNIKVSFMAFAFGALYGLGTIFILLSNGLMLGSIAAVFAQHGLLFDFSTTVLIHGTLELFAVMVAGAAGLRFGQALFRPQEAKRIDALYIFGKEAFEVCCIMIPVFIVAGILEGFVTHLHLPSFTRILIISGSILLLVFYLIVPTVFYITRRKEPPPVAPDVYVKLS
jgi:uncharacterized membrane protein SpoIIM required for sporulation